MFEGAYPPGVTGATEAVLPREKENKPGTNDGNSPDTLRITRKAEMISSG